MKDFEQQLRSAPLAPPPPELDDRMAALLAEPSSEPRAARRVPRWPWWLGAAATLAGAAVLLLSTDPGSASREAPAPAVYRIPPRGPMRSFLLEPTAARSDPLRVVVRVSHP